MKSFFYLLIILAFVFWSAIKTYVHDSYATLDADHKVALNIPMWTPVKKVWALLKENLIIERDWTFFLYLKLNKLEWKIQAWDYIFSIPINIQDLVTQLQNSKQEEVRLIVPEWYTIDDIDALLTDKWLLKKWEFSTCAIECKFPEYNFFYDGDIEGYLFPDTYFVPIQKFTAKWFIKRMLDNFQRRVLTEEIKTNYKDQWKTLKDIIIMASMIEREEKTSNNRPYVAWILWKRLELGIPLWVDATTRYYNKNKSWALFKKDFEDLNPYNTRRVRGLPPTAISNPWYNAIISSINYKQSDYLYYLHDKTWKIHFSKTNDEHNYKKFKYLK